GQFFEYIQGQLGDHPAGRVHSECQEEFQKRFAKSCLHCRQPVIRMGGFSGRHFNYQEGHFSASHGTGPVHEECHEAFLRRWAPSCSQCKEPLLKSSRFSGRIFEYGRGQNGVKQAVHEECQVDFERARRR
ncbi:Pentatricopeptide repeat-containing protein, partial [Durusdinium trenchii]